MIIYKVTNLNSGNSYIGQTIKSLEERKEQHIIKSKKGKSKFHKALNSYGVNSFSWEIIDNAETKDELNEKEINYIKQYNTIANGYNMVEGGTGGYNEFAVEANKKRKGKTHKEIYTPDGLLVIQSTYKKNGERLATYSKNRSKSERITLAKSANKARTEKGYTHSDETKEKISNSQSGVSKEERYGREKSDKLKKLISERTKEAMAKLDRVELQRKANIGRTKFWNTKHEDDRNKLLELKSKGLDVKTIIAEMGISYPTYYARLNELKKNKYI